MSDIVSQQHGTLAHMIPPMRHQTDDRCQHAIPPSILDAPHKLEEDRKMSPLF